MVRRVVLGMLLLIAIGVLGHATREVIRGSIWLGTTETPFHQEAEYGSGFPLSARQAARRSMLKINLKQIGLALHNYHDVSESLPAGGTFGPEGKGYDSWMTGIDVFVGFWLNEEYRDDEPWNSENNARYYRSVIPMYLNPTLPAAPVVDEDGFAFSHIAANQHVIGPNFGMRFEDITDGAEHTLFVGEVNSLFQPWGAPTNWRDPMLGLNTSPRGFGSHPDAGGVMFLIGDGSVSFLSNDIDPGVLKALSTPDGGESINASDW